MNFMPHGHCYFWKPEILWLHLVSDILIAAAYFSIPIMLFFAVTKFPTGLNSLFTLFAFFITLCGATHLVSAWTIWNPDYYFEGLLKGLTAGVSIFTAFELFKLLKGLKDGE